VRETDEIDSTEIFPKEERSTEGEKPYSINSPGKAKIHS